MVKRKRLGEILMDAGLINETQLSAALHSQKTWGGKLGSTLVRMGFVSEESILKCLSAQLKLPSADFAKLTVSPKAIGAVPFSIAEKYNVIPVALREEMGKKTVILAMSDPTNLDVVSEIEFQAGIRIRPVVATESAITKAIDRYYRAKDFRTEYGHEKRVDLAALDAQEEMVIISGGKEHTLPAEEAPASAPGSDKLAKALVRVLVRKGVLTKEEIQAALRELS